MVATMGARASSTAALYSAQAGDVELHGYELVSEIVNAGLCLGNRFLVRNNYDNASSNQELIVMRERTVSMVAAHSVHKLGVSTYIPTYLLFVAITP